MLSPEAFLPFTAHPAVFAYVSRRLVWPFRRVCRANLGNIRAMRGTSNSCISPLARSIFARHRASRCFCIWQSSPRLATSSSLPHKFGQNSCNARYFRLTYPTAARKHFCPSPCIPLFLYMAVVASSCHFVEFAAQTWAKFVQGAVFRTHVSHTCQETFLLFTGHPAVFAYVSRRLVCPVRRVCRTDVGKIRARRGTSNSRIPPLAGSQRTPRSIRWP